MRLYIGEIRFRTEWAAHIAALSIRRSKDRLSVSRRLMRRIVCRIGECDRNKLMINDINGDSVSFDAYEKMAGYYFEDVDIKPFNAYFERPATLSLLPDVQGKSVLDAGCAAGWYSNWLLEQGANVTAVDFSPNMVAMTKKRVGNKAAVRQADLHEPLPFLADRSMDIVVSSLALHYLKTWEIVLAEFNRILKPQGLLIFSVHHPLRDFAAFPDSNYFRTETVEEEWEMNGETVKVRFYRRSLSTMITALLDAGLIIDKFLEPTPTRQFAELHPEDYKQLTTKPHFLMIRARKS